MNTQEYLPQRPEMRSVKFHFEPVCYEDNLKAGAFDIDNSGFLKNTAWLNNNDAFLFLDRNYNASIDAGKELFSNSTVNLTARGLNGLRRIDSNYDDKLN